MAASSYKSCGAYVLSIRSAPCLIDSLLFLKLICVYFYLLKGCYHE
ncbi:recombinase RecF [Rickettsia parkeri]|nr:recombinase RecF [Rickettsia parkeri]